MQYRLYIGIFLDECEETDMLIHPVFCFLRNRIIVAKVCLY